MRDHSAEHHHESTNVHKEKLTIIMAARSLIFNILHSTLNQGSRYIEVTPK